MDAATLKDLKTRAHAARERAETARKRLRLGEATYDEALAAAKEFGRCANQWHRARFGKPMRFSPHSFIR